MPNYFDLVVMFQELKESMRLALKELKRLDNNYNEPSHIRLQLQISNELYKEIFR